MQKMRLIFESLETTFRGLRLGAGSPRIEVALAVENIIMVLDLRLCRYPAFSKIEPRGFLAIIFKVALGFHFRGHHRIVHALAAIVSVKYLLVMHFEEKQLLPIGDPVDVYAVLFEHHSFGWPTIQHRKRSLLGYLRLTKTA